MRVLVVDDSVVFRSQIKTALQGAASIEVVGTANNGRIALQKLAQSSVDLITLDMEMPEMGGLETIREIRKARFPLRIIVFSSQTAHGSEAALEALAAGADDLVPKPSGPGLAMENAADRIREQLIPKILQFDTSAKEPRAASKSASRDLDTFVPSVIVIGSSTGGPPALEKILQGISNPSRIPILIAQHMPPVFTASLAKRLEQICGITAAEAKKGEEIRPNRIYVAPGNYHLSVSREERGFFVSLDQGPPRNSVRPAVDTLFESAVRSYGNRTMGIVLTGMGEDGLLGSAAIKSAGGGVMIQDRASSVVFGMPGAIYAAGHFDRIGDLPSINSVIRRMTQ